MSFKTGVWAYAILLLYGGFIWNGETGEMVHRPGWAQWGYLLFWAAIALVILYIVFDRSVDDG